MNLIALKSEIQTDPKGLGYAQLLPNSPGRVADLINAKTFSMNKPRFITARTIFAECVGAQIIWDALNNAAQASSAVKFAVSFLNQDSGIDIGNDATQSMIDSLVPTVITAAQATALKNLALQPASRADLLALSVVYESDLRAAGVV